MRDNSLVRPVSLNTFAEYVNTNGAERMRMIAQQRSMYLGQSGPAYLPYQSARDGIRQAVREGSPMPLRQMVFRATTTMVSHYQELADGMEAFMAKHKPVFIEARSTTWTYGPLTINLTQHIGMRIKGKDYVVLPYLKPQILTSDGAKVIWRTLEHTRDQTMPACQVAALDVRRNKLFKPTTIDRGNLDCWIESEAVGYVEHWRRAA
ncbi:hypothetical protein ACVGOW_13015 [Pseudonocardia saturnea]